MLATPHVRDAGGACPPTCTPAWSPAPSARSGTAGGFRNVENLISPCSGAAGENNEAGLRVSSQKIQL